MFLCVLIAFGCAPEPVCAEDSFKDFLQRDRAAYREFIHGKKPRVGSRLPAAPPAPIVESALLVVRPEDDAIQHIWTNGAAVLVPAAAVAGETSIEVEPVAVPDDAPVEIGSYRPLSAWDVTITPSNGLQTNITLSLPFDDARLNARVSPQNQVMVLMRDSDRTFWRPLPARVPPGEPAATIQLNRGGRVRCVSTAFEPRPPGEQTDRGAAGAVLVGGLISGGAVLAHYGYEWIALDSYDTGRFRILCDATNIAAHARVGNAVWPASGHASTNPALSGAPRFVKDLAAFADAAWNTYTNLGFAMPPVPFTIKIDPYGYRLLTDAPGLYDFKWNRMYVMLDGHFDGKAEDLDALRERVAHEIFHGVQDRMLTMRSLGTEALKKCQLYLESTAEYAGNRVPWGLDRLGIQPHCLRLLQLPLAATDYHEFSSTHSCDGMEYDKGFLIAYIARAHGFDFRAMNEAVMRGLTAAVSDDPFLPRLNTYLVAATGQPLRDHYRGFVPYYLFSDAVDRRLIDYGCAERNDRLGPGTRPITWTAGLEPRFTAKAWALWRQAGLDSQTAVPVTLALTRLTGDVVVDVFALADHKPVHNPAPIAQLESPGATIDFELDEASCRIVYAVAINRSGQPAEAAMTATVRPTPLQVTIESDYEDDATEEMRYLTTLRLVAKGGIPPYRHWWRLSYPEPREGRDTLIETCIPYPLAWHEDHPDAAPDLVIRPGPPATLEYRIIDAADQELEGFQNVGETPAE